MRLPDFIQKVRQAMPVKAPLDPDFLPAATFLEVYESSLEGAATEPVAFAIERAQGLISTFRMRCHADAAAWGQVNCFLMERLAKTLLWA